ncbi:MAG: helix-turn-helix domain-containing protein, partial [Planctomycetaceae bacterium]
FRVNTFEIHLPPLRERRDDIPELARHLIARQLKRSQVAADIIPPEAMETLLAHSWNGNVRELANALEHAVILAEGQPIRPDDLPASVVRGSGKGSGYVSKLLANGPKTLRQIEMEVIYHVLRKHEGDKPTTAGELGIALKTLYNKLNQYEAQGLAG